VAAVFGPSRLDEVHDPRGEGGARPSAGVLLLSRSPIPYPENEEGVVQAYRTLAYRKDFARLR
jgi:hypothetical protein